MLVASVCSDLVMLHAVAAAALHRRSYGELVFTVAHAWPVSNRARRRDCLCRGVSKSFRVSDHRHRSCLMPQLPTTRFWPGYVKTDARCRGLPSEENPASYRHAEASLMMASWPQFCDSRRLAKQRCAIVRPILQSESKSNVSGAADVVLCWTGVNSLADELAPEE